MNERDVTALAARTFNGVVAQIEDDQWDQSLPAWFHTSGEPREKTLRTIINEHAYDDAWVPDMLAGRTMAEVGMEAWRGDLLGGDPRTNFATYADAAVRAIEGVTDLDRTVHCSFGDFSTREFLKQVASYRGMRAHDVARVIGIGTELPADLVQGLYDLTVPLAEEWRAIGVFGPRIEVPDTAPLQDRLLGLTGRQPDHTT